MTPSSRSIRSLGFGTAAAIALAACAETTLQTSREHPANPRVHAEALPNVATALTPGFDPFLAYPAESSPEPTTPNHQHAPATEPSEDGAVYTCPMHPEILRKAPGNCPICGMRLVPKEPPKPAPHPAP